jgi:hypothetical protein
MRGAGAGHVDSARGGAGHVKSARVREGQESQQWCIHTLSCRPQGCLPHLPCFLAAIAHPLTHLHHIPSSPSSACLSSSCIIPSNNRESVVVLATFSNAVSISYHHKKGILERKSLMVLRRPSGKSLGVRPLPSVLSSLLPLPKGWRSVIRPAYYAFLHHCLRPHKLTGWICEFKVDPEPGLARIRPMGCGSHAGSHKRIPGRIPRADPT